MTRVVLDASVVISGCGWGAESYRCLVHVGRRRARSYVSVDIVEEWRETLSALHRGGTKFSRDPWPALEWLIEVSHRVEPAPLGKQRSRAPNDDPYLACALAARASFIISRDPHLLTLSKPFGIEILTPRAYLSRAAGGPAL